VRIKLADNTIIIADGFDPVTNTIYEFWGDKWHGNPKTTVALDIHSVTKRTYKSLYEQTLEKIRRIITSNFNLIDIWENDWDNLPAVRS
jgi:hypothetical protein